MRRFSLWFELCFKLFITYCIRGCDKWWSVVWMHSLQLLSEHNAEDGLGFDEAMTMEKDEIAVPRLQLKKLHPSSFGKYVCMWSNEKSCEPVPVRRVERREQDKSTFYGMLYRGSNITGNWLTFRQEKQTTNADCNQAKT